MNRKISQLDRQHVWHPFTQMKDWMKEEPIVIASGKGAVLKALNGRSYLDGNSSIWTNLHGHNHPALNRAINSQLKKIAHSSSLGLANIPASLLASELVTRCNLRGSPPRLEKVFFSDDGSTAMETALKMAYQYSLRTGRSKKPRFLSLTGGYHGDTVGAVSLGHIDLFHRSYQQLLFNSDAVMAPYCYRCPFNKARPAREDARLNRQCRWECVGLVEQRLKKSREPYAGFVVEPLLQGAAGMIPQPEGWLKQVGELAKSHQVPLIADEVMTGCGRAGGGAFLASHREEVVPDFVALGKGLTGGYLPMAATVTTREVFESFLGNYDEFKTFFHGHSYTGNQLGASVALANLELLQSEKSLKERASLGDLMRKLLEPLWRHDIVGDVRQEGTVAAIELVKDWKTRESFDLRQQIGIRVCKSMAREGVLTRPIGNVIVLMPPFCTTKRQLQKMVDSLEKSLQEISR